MAYDTTEAVAKFLSGFQMKITNRERDTVAPDYYVKAHDMENGRDGLDDNAPEKDAPEKDDRNAQPPVDTDNR